MASPAFPARLCASDRGTYPHAACLPEHVRNVPGLHCLSHVRIWTTSLARVGASEPSTVPAAQ